MIQEIAYRGFLTLNVQRPLSKFIEQLQRNSPIRSGCPSASSNTSEDFTVFLTFTGRSGSSTYGSPTFTDNEDAYTPNSQYLDDGCMMEADLLIGAPPSSTEDYILEEFRTITLHYAP